MTFCNQEKAEAFSNYMKVGSWATLARSAKP
jgi:hypothetical protein